MSETFLSGQDYLLSMRETIKIEFSELSKQIVANVRIEVEDDKEINASEILQKTKDLFDQAIEYATTKTVRKAIGH